MSDTAELVYPYSYSRINNSERTLSTKNILTEIRITIAPFRFSLAAKGIINELQPTPNSSILELGSGLGILGEEIKKQTGSSVNYIGLDLVYNSVKENKNKGILSVQTDINHIPLKDKSVDFVVATDVFEHLSNAPAVVDETIRVLKPGGKGFIVIADPSEARFNYVVDHINRNNRTNDVSYWEKLFNDKGLKILPNSIKYRRNDWRLIFNLPILSKLKDKPGFACAFNPINRPGVYVVQKEVT